LSTRTSILNDRFQAIGALCERLLHPSATEEGERARQKRLLQVLFGAPFVALAATVQLLGQVGGKPAAITLVPLIFGLTLIAPLALIVTGRRRVVEAGGLCIGVLGVAMIIALGGGVGSAFTALAAALVVEPAWITRERRAMAWGLMAAVLALAISVGFDTAIPSNVEPSAWSWLTPLLYGSVLLMRFPFVQDVTGTERSQAVNVDAIVVATGATILRLQSNGDVTEAAAQARTALGVEPDILLGSGFFERVLISDRVAYLSALADLREGKTVGSLRLRIRVPAEGNSGLGAIYRTFVADMSAEQGGEIVMVLRDDEIASRLEGSLADARSEVEEAVQLRDQLLASVSHELRTPLNAIVGFSDVLTNEMFGPFANDRQREYVTLINEASCHLLNVVNAVLDVSKIQAGTYVGDVEEFELAASAKLSMAMVAGEANAKAVNLELDLDERIGTVRCDRRALQQILINLLSNAVKFTPEGTVRLSARKRGQRLFLTVSDTGIGIASEDLSRLGKPFTQIKNEHTSKGTGLGLALVNGLVQASGGSVNIESAPGAGTKVHVSLPVGEEFSRICATPDDSARLQNALMDGIERKSGANSSGEWNEIPLRKTA